MTIRREATSIQDPLAEIIQRLLEFNFVITDMIERMLVNQASGRSAPDADPIPDVVRRLLRSAVEGVAENHSRQELRGAADIIDQMLDAISEDLFYVDPELYDGGGPGQTAA